MNEIDAIKELARLSFLNKYVYRRDELGRLFKLKDDSLENIITQLLNDGILWPATDNIFVYRLFDSSKRDIIGDIATTLRPMEYNYESFESAASQWSIISQIPMSRMMVATTGDSGEITINGGVVIEFIHICGDALEIAKRYIDREPRCALPIANKKACLNDLLQFNRSLDLIDWEEAEEE